MIYNVIKNIPNHIELQSKVTGEVWPEFMFHDPIANENWHKLFDQFSPFQLTLMSGEEVIAIANSIPLHWDRPMEELPDGGWDWAILKAVEDNEKGITPNVLCGLQISLNRNYLGKGLSSHVLQEMVNAAKEHGLTHVILPVRPNLKAKYPLTPNENYIKWETPEGNPFDSWMRVHVKFGGRIVKACDQSMYVPGTIAEWEEWTNMKFPESGDYVIEGALAPIKISVEKDLGEYYEPNVWIVHDVQAR